MVRCFQTSCPHLGCGVDYSADRKAFTCPCHASEFAVDGTPRFGPSPRPMDQLACRVTEPDGQGQRWIEVDYQEGTDQEVTMHDGSRITLHKLNHNYDPTSRMQAITQLNAAVAEGKFLTGLIYLDEERPEFVADLNLCETPLAYLQQDVLQPPPEALDQINAELMK